jgi:rhodanese-related sulfurtransferase
MSIQRISPHQAHQLIEGGALLFDIREPDEYAREHILQARNVPLARLVQAPLQTDGAHAVVFHCKGGARTSGHATSLAAATACDTYILEGGLDAWKGAGLPVVTDRKQPLEIMRQVQITAGGLVLLGVVLGATVQPVFYALAGFVGAGLMFAGIRGTCAMASLLRRMPWNRRVA